MVVFGEEAGSCVGDNINIVNNFNNFIFNDLLMNSKNMLFSDTLIALMVI